jgi:hypothetical protein
LKHDVIHDALRVICNKNLKRLRNFSDIGSFGNMGTGTNLANNRKIAKVFLTIWGLPCIKFSQIKRHYFLIERYTLVNVFNLLSLFFL